MQKTLLVCSPSTRSFLPQYEHLHIVRGAPTKQTLKMMDTRSSVVAIGGGAVIDTAKIICSEPIICYPTTAAGSSNTSHSVCWDGKEKLSIKRFVPKDVIIVDDFVNSLPSKAKEYTTYDVISHCLDSLWSKKRTDESEHYANLALKILRSKYSNSDLIQAGVYGGMAIEICPTTILHALSYPLTAHYGISHGQGLGYLLPRVCRYYDFILNDLINYEPISLGNIDWDLICSESLKYDKIYNTEKTINFKILKKIVKN